MSATVSPSEPIFDEATLTLKVRLEASNPQRALKPGMFVDVEFPVDLPAALVVPADAIVDSGLRKRCSSTAATDPSSRGWSRRGGASATTSR